MQGAIQQRRIVRFGAFEVDLEAGELRKNGIRLKLQEQPFRVLTLLLEHPGEIITREEIQRQLWPEDTFVDFENSLNSAVARLRDVLGDSATRPRFVETVPRKGYCFIGVVDGAATSVPPPARGKTGWRALAAAGALGLLAAAAFGIFSRTEEPPEPLAVSVLTSYLGHEQQPSFSPDGRQVAFSWDGERRDNFDIYVKLLGSGDPYRLTSDPAHDWSPAWSPDGGKIAFVRHSGTGSAGTLAVYLVPALGGAPEKLHETEFSNLNLRADSLLAWTANGSWLVAPCRPDNASAISLCLVSPETREAYPLTSPPPECKGDLGPSLSPDGRTLAFTRFCGHSLADIYLLQLDNDLRPEGKAQRLTHSNRWATSAVWLPNGREVVYFSGGSGSEGQLVRVSVDAPDKSSLLWFAGGSQGSLAVHGNAGETKLIYTSLRENSNIWRISLSQPERRPLRPPEQFLASAREDALPQFSPDGERIVFRSNRSGSSEIWVSDREGSKPRPLTRTGARISGFPRWSPNGRDIVFHSRPEGQADVFVVSAEGGPIRRLTTYQGGDVSPSWSRDGKWVYFSSSRGGAGIWKIPAAGGEAVRLTSDDGGAPFESWDGQWLFYDRAPGYQLWKRPLSPGDIESESSEVLRSTACYACYAVVPQGIYYLAGRDGYAEGLRLLELDSGRDTEIARLDQQVGMGLTVSPDRQTVLYTAIEQSGSDLMLLENVR